MLKVNKFLDTKNVIIFLLILLFSIKILPKFFIFFLRAVSKLLPKSELYQIEKTTIASNSYLILTGEIFHVDPQQQIHNFRYLFQNGLVSSAFLLILFLVIFSILRNTRYYNILISTIAALTVIVFSFYTLLLVDDCYDETYLFATQIRNVITNGMYAIEITGPNNYAEASADVLATIFAGFIGRVFSLLTPETLTILSGLFGASIFIIYVFFQRNIKKFEIINLLLIILLIFSPPIMGSVSTGFPTPWVVLACYLSFEVLRDEVHNHNTSSNNFKNCIVFAIRPDVGVILFFTRILLYFCEISNYKTFRFFVRNFISRLLFTFIFVGLWTLYRLYYYGSPLPSGIMGKNAKISGDFLLSGSYYFENMQNSSYGISIIFVAFIYFLFVSSKRILITQQLIFSLFFFLIILLGILGGGDWFPAYWQRYTLPVAIALFIFTFIHLAPVKNVISISISVLFILLTSSSYKELGNTQSYSASRATCLATLGKTLINFFPEDVGLATSELNTLSFYSKQSVTDLIGLADPRVALTELRPLSSGDILHRRNNPNIIMWDRPGLVYLFSDDIEGIDCSGGKISSSSKEEKFQIITDFLNSNRAKYRAGNTSFISLNYLPVFIKNSKETAIMLWVRNDLVDEMKSLADKNKFKVELVVDSNAN